MKSIHRVYDLIDRYQKRQYLKPWWKTNFEFAEFINRNFRDDHIKQLLCTWICGNESSIPASDELRSQIAKHVIHITKQLLAMGGAEKHGLQEPLEDDEFFIIERAARFYDPNVISKLDVVMKNSEIISFSDSKKELYVKKLTNIVPQRDYYSLYFKENFYIFSKALSEKITDTTKRNKHYHMLEKIFVFVSTSLIRNGADNFQDKFVEVTEEELKKNELKSCEEIFRAFISSEGIGVE